MPTVRTDEFVDRFWSSVDVGISGLSCWEWTGALTGNGYGTVSTGSRGFSVQLSTHRLAYELLVGPIPVGLVIDHLCRNRACVNPDHLEPVTQVENHRRGVHRQVMAAISWAKTHCVWGHEFTPENTGRRRDGGRNCRACIARRSRDSRARMKIQDRLTKSVEDYANGGKS